MDNLFDVVVVGSGPAGNSAAIYAARAKLRTVMLDRARFGGALAAAEKIANYPGFPEAVRGITILEAMRQQALHFGAEFVQTEVYGVDLTADPKKVFTAEGEFLGHTLIIATGAGQRGKRIPGEEQFLGRGVSYCATCDAAFFKDHEVAVIGDGEQAAEEGLFLAKFARRVHLIGPRERLRVSPDLANHLASEEKIVLHLGWTTKEVVGRELVEGVVIEDRHGDRELVPVSGVFFYLLGNRPAADFLYQALEQDEQGYIAVDEHMATSVPGVFAVGDVRHGVLKQVATAVADGAIAGVEAEKYLSRRAHLVKQPA